MDALISLLIGVAAVLGFVALGLGAFVLNAAPPRPLGDSGMPAPHTYCTAQNARVTGALHHLPTHTSEDR
jgi:hypothetical protein